MQKKMVLLLSALMLTVLTGCSSVQTASPASFNGLKLSAKGETVAHVSGFANGLYFLTIPLLTGSTEHVGLVSVFSDTVNVTKVTGAVTKRSQELEANATIDLSSSSYSTSFAIPPIPYPIFSWKSVYVSGNAVKK